MKHVPIIGLEIHTELKTATKMFCSCKNDPKETRPNINICPICMGHPGTLPVINKNAVELVIKTGLALNCKINKETYFERKNYFYPDLPKGYQISQNQLPLCKDGYLDIPAKSYLEAGKLKRIRINRIHLEEDTGKLIHPEGTDYSLIDFNRAGVPLMELVTEPDIRSAKEAGNFARELQLILRYLNVSNADMEKGQMRIEVNISLSNRRRMRTNESRIPNESRIVLKDESYKLMGLLFEIHKKLGPIYKEKNYQDAIEEILKREKIPYEREKKIILKFENLKVSDFFADFVIDNKILLEVKAKRFITKDDIRQASRYIKSMNLPLAIIANFKRKKLEYKRVINPVFGNNSFGENSFEKNSISFEENSRNTLGTKVEIKNLNSIRSVEKAIEFEIKRQTELLEKGEKIVQETRGWHDIRQETFSQREKEESHDYRYFPEPDLPPLKLKV
jgi:GxxExxY protein